MFKKQIIDITGVSLTPSKNGKKCLGNGENKYCECCCDECDYFLKCFSHYKKRKAKHFKRQIFEKNIDKVK